MSRENIERVRGGYEAFARGDLEAVLELLDPDVDWQPAIAPILGVEAVRGREGVRQFLTRDLFEGFDEFRAEPLSFEDLGETVLVMVRYTGRGESTGLELKQTFAAVYEIRDGKTVRMRDYPSRAEALEAEGLAEYAMSQGNLELVRQHIEAYAAGDAEGALKFVDPEVEVDLSRAGLDAEIFHGHAGLARSVRSFRGAFIDYRFEIRRLVDADDRVVGLIRDGGRGKASGVESDRFFALVYALRSGRIVRMTGYSEDREALEAAGLSE